MIKSLRLQVNYLQGVQTDLDAKLNAHRLALKDHESMKADTASYRDTTQNMTDQSERMRGELEGLVRSFEEEKDSLLAEVHTHTYTA